MRIRSPGRIRPVGRIAGAVGQGGESRRPRERFRERTSSRERGRSVRRASSARPPCASGSGGRVRRRASAVAHALKQVAVRRAGALGSVFFRAFCVIPAAKRAESASVDEIAGAVAEALPHESFAVARHQNSAKEGSGKQAGKRGASPPPAGSGSRALRRACGGRDMRFAPVGGAGGPPRYAAKSIPSETTRRRCRVRIADRPVQGGPTPPRR